MQSATLLLVSNMKKFRNLVIGGLQQKIFNLVVISMVLVAACFQTISLWQSNHLKTLSEETNDRQQESIFTISTKTMDTVLSEGLLRSTRLEAAAADSIFSQLDSAVTLLADYAENLYNNPSSAGPASVDEPDPSKDGTITVQLLTDENADQKDVQADVRLLGNLSDLMKVMFKTSDHLNSCFIGTENGVFIVADNRSAAKFDEDGKLQSFPVSGRSWYQLAIEKGERCFTDIEPDYFTDEQGIVCAKPVYRNGEAVAVVGADLFLSSMSELIGATEKISNSFAVINQKGHVLYASPGQNLFKADLSDNPKDMRESENFLLSNLVTDALKIDTEVAKIAVGSETYYIAGSPLKTLGWTLISFLDSDEIRKPSTQMQERYTQIQEEAAEEYRKNVSSSVRTGSLLILLAFILGTSGALVLAKRIVRPVTVMTDNASKLRGEDLIFRMDDVYRTGDEIEEMAKTFAELSERTQLYIRQITEITSEKERINTELNLATRIQADMLPSIFPAFPERSEFDIYADMTPAREVGGDFYDYFLIDDDHLCMVIADVSGKGIPAALFMMASKIIISNYAMQGNSPKDVLRLTNEQICRASQEDMFVTVWCGILEISTGKVTAANAGHEYPVIRHPGGKFELYKDKHGFVIGGMSGMKYTEYEFTLEPGSLLFLYTDGVTEATDDDMMLYGTDRMIDALNSENPDSPVEVLKTMYVDVKEFVKDAPQFDDLTMLCLKYSGKENESEE